MVTAELIYNPYLRETKVKFNGQEPRANSLVEKYLNIILQEWTEQIPKIFYDELNGYDFELEFSGTELDCQCVCDSFKRANVSEEWVRIFHKGELDSREIKLRYVNQFMTWLEKNSCRKFDYEKFVEQYKDELELYLSCLYIDGYTVEEKIYADYVVSVEGIDSIEELDHVNYENVPIVLKINSNTVAHLGKNIGYLLEKKDVIASQIFFLMDESVRKNNVERIIKDLGIANPQIIYSLKDEMVSRYIELYPVTAYLNKVIQTLNCVDEKITDSLKKEQEELAVTNKEIYRQINQLEDSLKKLKFATDKFNNRDNIESAKNLEEAKSNWYKRIYYWKTRKFSMKKEADAIEVATAFAAFVNDGFQKFIREVSNTAERIQKDIYKVYNDWYKATGMEGSFVPDAVSLEKNERKHFEVSPDEFLKLKEEKYVEAKDAVIERLFRTTDKKEAELTLVVNYDFQKWKNYALDKMRPFASGIIEEKNTRIKNYAAALADCYLIQLQRLIEECIDKKEAIMAQLSDDELKLQLDEDWFVEFQDQLRKIERG